MSLSDCDHCWETLCCCGWKYRDWPRMRRVELAAAALGISVIELETLLGNSVPAEHPMSKNERWNRNKT